MKYLAIIAVVLGGSYLTPLNAVADTQLEGAPNFESWSQVLDKVATEGASTEEVKFGANLLAKFFCDDELFQTEVNKTVESCNKVYLSLRSRCEKEIFEDTQKIYSIKKEAAKVARAYSACVGAI